MNVKLLVILFLFCLILMTRAADKKDEKDAKAETDSKTDVKTVEKENKKDIADANVDTDKNKDKEKDTKPEETKANDKENTKTETKNDDKANTNTETKDNNNKDDKNDKNSKDEGYIAKANDLGDGHIDSIINTNTTLDECGTTSSQLGMFSFSRPISKSVIVQYSNFTIIWYYNNIIYDTYAYPTNNITLSLFFEEDGNTNNWSSSWKNPVWEKTIPMNEIEEGPLLTNNVKSYQWSWKIMYDDKGASNEGYVQSLRTNEKYKLRISGDGKDLQRNENLKCYQDGDIMPGTTRAFYIVENAHIPSYSPMNITDGALTISTIKILSQILLPMAVAFFYLFMN